MKSSMPNTFKLCADLCHLKVKLAFPGFPGTACVQPPPRPADSTSETTYPPEITCSWCL